ncbi:MAG: PIN domain-containing protein [Clostridiales bacterium]|nr:PIN domain-containing protein [Clostridiales bacterium]
MKRAIYVDYENVSLSGLKDVEELGADDVVKIFIGAQNQKLSMVDANRIFNCEAGVELITNKYIGKNALDFIIMVHMGHDIALSLAREYYIISKDKGYDPAIHEMKRLCGLTVKRCEDIAAIFEKKSGITNRLKGIFKPRRQSEEQDTTEHMVVGKKNRNSALSQHQKSDIMEPEKKQPEKKPVQNKKQPEKKPEQIKKQPEKKPEQNKEQSEKKPEQIKKQPDKKERPKQEDNVSDLNFQKPAMDLKSENEIQHKGKKTALKNTNVEADNNIIEADVKNITEHDSVITGNVDNSTSSTANRNKKRRKKINKSKNQTIAVVSNDNNQKNVGKTAAYNEKTVDAEENTKVPNNDELTNVENSKPAVEKKCRKRNSHHHSGGGDNKAAKPEEKINQGRIMTPEEEEREKARAEAFAILGELDEQEKRESKPLYIRKKQTPTG